MSGEVSPVSPRTHVGMRPDQPARIRRYGLRADAWIAVSVAFVNATVKLPLL